MGKGKKGNKKFVPFVDKTQTDNTAKEHKVQTETSTDKKCAEALKYLQIQATPSKQGTEQEESEILSDKNVEKRGQALGEKPCDVTSQPIQRSIDIGQNHRKENKLNHNLPKNLEKSEQALGEKLGDNDLISQIVQKSIGLRENHRNLEEENINHDLPTQQALIKGSEKMHCEKRNLRDEKANYETERSHKERDGGKRDPIDNRSDQDFNHSKRDKRNFDNTQSTYTGKSHYRGDASHSKTFADSQSQPHYENRNRRDSNQNYHSRNNRDYSSRDYSSRNYSSRRENSSRSFSDDKQYNSNYSGSRNFGNKKYQNNSTYKNNSSDSSKQHDHTVDHSWEEDRCPTNISKKHDHGHKDDTSWDENQYPTNISKQHDHDHKDDTSSSADYMSKDPYPSKHDHQNSKSYGDQKSPHKRVISSNIDTSWMTNLEKPNLNKSWHQDQQQDSVGQQNDSNISWDETTLGSQQSDNLNISTNSWDTETILEPHSDQSPENVTETARVTSMLNVNAESFVPGGQATKGVQKTFSSVGARGYRETFSDVNDKSQLPDDRAITRHKDDKLYVSSEEIKEPLRPSKTNNNLDGWSSVPKKENNWRNRNQRSDSKERQSEDNKSNLSTNKSSRFDNFGRNFDYKRRNSRDFTDAEYQEYKKDFAKNPDLKKVTEIEQDLFAMSKDYSLAHCVAEDLRMGSGIAVQFKREFKELGYLLGQKQKQGGLAVLDDEKNNRYIYYLVTKRESTGKPTYETMWKSLQKMRDHIRDNNVAKLALPRLGCGLDRLEWSDVKAFIAFLFRDVDVEIVVCNFQQNLDENLGIPPKDNSCKVFNEYDKHISEIESGTTILYFTSEDNEVTPEMITLHNKFYINKDFNAKSQKKMGDLIKTDYQKGTYILYGCVVKRKKHEDIDFREFEKCILQINKNNKADLHYYVAFQAQKSERDSLLTEKLITIARNRLRNVDVYVCHKELLDDVKK